MICKASSVQLMPAIQINSDTEKEVDPPGSEFVFYKITRPKSCNKRTQLLAGRYIGLAHHNYMRTEVQIIACCGYEVA